MMTIKWMKLINKKGNLSIFVIQVNHKNLMFCIDQKEKLHKKNKIPGVGENNL